MPTQKPSYTIEQIKKAFWDEFHQTGECWFDYLASPEENEKCTNSYWESFKLSLDESQKEKI